MVGGEQGGIFAAACSNLSLGGACGGLPSISDATGLASSLTSLASTATTAKLVDAVATGPLKSKLGAIAAERAAGLTSVAGLPAVSEITAPGGLVGAAQDAISGVTSNLPSLPNVSGVVGGALASVQSNAALASARDLVGQGTNVVGGVVARGKDAVTQAQTLAADSISEAQVAAKAVANNSLSAVKDKATETASGLIAQAKDTVTDKAEDIIESAQDQLPS